MPYDDRLVDYRQTIKELKPGHCEVRTYARVAPVIVQAKRGVRLLSQSGYAVGFLCKIKPQAPLFPDTLMADADVSTEQMDSEGFEWKTTWTYIMAIADDQVIDYATWQGLPAVTEVY